MDIVVQGADFKLVSAFVDKEGYTADLTDGIARVIIKTTPSQPDVDAITELNSTDNPELFDFTNSETGKVTVRIPGSYLAALDITEQKKLLIQLEVVVNSDQYYRSSVVPFTVTESLFED